MLRTIYSNCNLGPLIFNFPILYRMAFVENYGAVPLEADPTTLYIYKVGCKSRRVGDKNIFGSASTPRQDVIHTGLSGSRGRPAVGSGCFVQTGLETTSTSPKSLTDKP